MVDMLKRYIDAGAKGFGEHKPGIAFDDPRNLNLFAACAEAKLPVLFHLDNQRNTDQPGLPGLEKVLQETPQGTFIGHGPGWWASISGDITQAGLGGYPKGKVPLPSDDSGLIPYLEKVIALNPDNAFLQERLEQLQHPAAPVLLEEEAGLAGDTTLEPGPKPIPICGISE